MGVGQVGAEICMKKAIPHASEMGIAISPLIRVCHIGRIAEYAETARKQGWLRVLRGAGAPKRQRRGSGPGLGTRGFVQNLPRSEHQETPVVTGVFRVGEGGLEPSTSRM